MAILEELPIQTIDMIDFRPAAELGQDVLETYHYPAHKMRVEIVGSNDDRVPAAIAMEIANMARLGDDPEDVREEFLPYNEDSWFFLAFREDSPGLAEDMVAMGRIIPYTDKSENKTLKDLATIPEWVGSDAMSTQPAAQQAKETHTVEDVIVAFQAESGCTDLTKVWDIATWGVNLDAPERDQLRAADDVMASFTAWGIQAFDKGELTHVTAFNQSYLDEDGELSGAHHTFLKSGYPFNSMFGLKPMPYDTAESDQNMEAIPAWMSLAELKREVQLRTTRHMGVIASLRSFDVLPDVVNL